MADERKEQRYQYTACYHQVDWPAPGSEDALALGAFPKLSFFGFNNSLPPRWLYSPLYIIQSEEDYVNADQNDEAAWDERNDYLFYSQWSENIRPQDVTFNPGHRDNSDEFHSRILPRLFAMRCPTLRILREEMETWAFDRDADGRAARSVLSDGNMTAKEHRDATTMYNMRCTPIVWNVWS
ncbi:hypothetical protein PENSPDRAFT_752100 [Peniophora sp. CONT]|nr:hypothetical protein PENSPDRAFT_752100 [Peniophora sp. CONT]